MAPIVLTVLQIVFLLLLYLFVARAVRAVIRDVSSSRAAVPRDSTRATNERQPEAQRQQVAAQPAQKPRGGGRSGDRSPPRELVVHTPEGRPQVLRLDGSKITFGRSTDSTVALHDSYASDHHAEVFREGGEWLVTDRGSTNGTFLNQSRVSRPTPIAAGDQLGIGKTTVEVRK
jgi:pSer/pThr/pTyr-binding forkhead associated (FHA) protein